MKIDQIDQLSECVLLNDEEYSQKELLPWDQMNYYCLDCEDEKTEAEFLY